MFSRSSNGPCDKPALRRCSSMAIVPHGMCRSRPVFGMVSVPRGLAVIFQSAVLRMLVHVLHQQVFGEVAGVNLAAGGLQELIADRVVELPLVHRVPAVAGGVA